MSLSFFVRTGRRGCRRRERQKYNRRERERVRNCMQSTEVAMRNTEFMLRWDTNIEWPNFH